MNKVLVLLSILMTTAAAQAEMTSKDLLMRLHDVNQEEISAGQLAVQKAQSDQVKRFGQQILADHQRADQEVLNVAKQKGIDLSTSMPTSLGEAGQATKKTATLTKLQNLSGSTFDRTFVKDMESGHDGVIQMLESADSSDPEIASLTKKLLPQLKEHKRLAQNLMPMTEKE